MPIYEYLCPRCNRVFSFLARTARSEARPACPRCGATDLRRQVSRFAFVRAPGGSTTDAPTGSARPAGPEGADPLDDPRVEREMMRLMQDAENIDEHDPRQLARFMRRMSTLSGEPLDAEMEEAVRRLEAGEDPEKVEDDMGDMFGMAPDEEGFGAPSYDEGLYPLD